MNVPILGICYGLQEIAHTLGGTVSPCDKREYGKSEINILSKSRLFEGLSHPTVRFPHYPRI
jgi:GMP synthase (glutamine-hydrolysing)